MANCVFLSRRTAGQYMQIKAPTECPQVASVSRMTMTTYAVCAHAHALAKQITGNLSAF